MATDPEQQELLGLIGTLEEQGIVTSNMAQKLRAGATDGEKLVRSRRRSQQRIGLLCFAAVISGVAQACYEADLIGFCVTAVLLASYATGWAVFGALTEVFRL